MTMTKCIVNLCFLTALMAGSCLSKQDEKGIAFDDQRKFFGFPAVQDCLAANNKMPIIPVKCKTNGYTSYVFWDTAQIGRGVFLYEKVVNFRDSKPILETNLFLKRSQTGADSLFEVTFNFDIASQGIYPWVAPQSWGLGRRDMAAGTQILKRWGISFPAIDRWLVWAEANQPAQYAHFYRPEFSFSEALDLITDDTAITNALIMKLENED